MTEEIRNKIAEVKNAKNFENIDQVDDAGKALKELVYLLDELPGPVQSPSDLIVEVDGEVKGKLLAMSSDARIVRTLEGNSSPVYQLDMHHIRLLHPQGGVVLDNKMEE